MNERIIFEPEMPKIGKEEIPYLRLINNMTFEEGDRVLIVNSPEASLLLFFGFKYPNVTFRFYQGNVEIEEKIEEEIEKAADKNYLIGNVGIVSSLDNLRGPELDKVVIPLNGFISGPTFEYWLRKAARFLRSNGVVYIVTHKNWGSKKQEKILQEVFGNSEITKRGGGGYRILRSVKTGLVEEGKYNLVRFSLFGRNFEMRSIPGLFSWRELDEGTRYLLEFVVKEKVISEGKVMLDLGCGWGAIGIVVASLNNTTEVLMVDVVKEALVVAEENIRNFGLFERVRLFLGIEKIPSDRNVDLVLSNPPFHKKKEDLLELFKRVKKGMKKGGKIFLVVGEGYRDTFLEIFKDIFGFCEIVGEKSTPKGNFFILMSKK